MASFVRKPVLCDCGGGMALDAAAIARGLGLQQTPPVASQLCRAQLERFEAALSEGQPLLVACTQEAPLFRDLTADTTPAADLLFTNIRERAGWSAESAEATPKIIALLADALTTSPPVEGISFSSQGRCIILGHDDIALEAGGRLAERLEVKVILTGTEPVTPPSSTLFPVHAGQVRQAVGWLGQFSLMIDGFATANPSSRSVLQFAPPENGVLLECDLIIDLTGHPPLFPAHGRRDGYLRADPKRAALVERAIFDASDLVGTFDKPRYVTFRSDLCAHGRNRKTGCTRCLDICPTGAIQPAGDVVAIDPHICGGCGGCASICPTGAAAYGFPPGDQLSSRSRSLLRRYLAAGGTDPVLLLHDDKHGSGMIDLIARHGRGLPARVIPLSLPETDLIGIDLLLSAFAWGATRLIILAGPDGESAVSAIRQAQADAILAGLGIAAHRLLFIDESDPSAVEARLWSLPPLPKLADGSFLPMGTKRTVTLTAARLLANASATPPPATSPSEAIPLPAGSAFGRVSVMAEGCTLCHACVGACPTGALVDGGDQPRLSFIQDACVQCGLCRNTCPEQVITLHAELNLAESCRSPQLLKEEQPHHCERCGKAFATRSGIERVIARLASSGHPLLSTPGAIARLKLCGNCRVIDQFEKDPPALAFGTLPRPRTGDDDLRDRNRAGKEGYSADRA